MTVLSVSMVSHVSAVTADTGGVSDKREEGRRLGGVDSNAPGMPSIGESSSPYRNFGFKVSTGALATLSASCRSESKICSS